MTYLHTHTSSSSIDYSMAAPKLLLISQPSLPSIPSLTSPHNLRDYLGAHNYSGPCQVKQRPCDVTFVAHGQGSPCNYSYTSSLVLAGKHLFAASSDREIRVWKQQHRDSENRAGGVTVSAGKGAVKSLVVMSDRIFSAHQDHKVRVWRIINGGDDELFITRLATLPRLTDRLIKFLLPNSRVRIRRHKTATWVHHVDTVSALALSADNSMLYSVSWDRTVKIWRTRDFKCMESVANAHDDAINALAVSPDGYVYTGSADKKIKVWRKAKEEKKHSLVATLEKHNSGINALAVGNGGSVLYSGACDRSILVWEKEDYEKGGAAVAVVGALRGHTKSILCLAAAAEDILCSGSADKTVRIWRGVERCYSCLAVLVGHGGPVKCLTVARDLVDIPKDETLSKYILYSGSLDGDIKVWQISLRY